MIASWRRLAGLVFLLLASAATGCVYSTTPLTDAKTSDPNLKLIGMWEFTSKEHPDEPPSLVVVSRKAAEPNVLEIVGNDGKKKTTAMLYCTKIGHDDFASVVVPQEKGPPQYLIGKYELPGNSTLKFRGLNLEYLTAAVKNKELKGTVSNDKLIIDVNLDDTPENLARSSKIISISA